MRGLTHFEIRACVLALLVYGLVVPVVPVAEPVLPAAPAAVAELVTALDVVPVDPPAQPAQPVAVPEVLSEVVGVPAANRTVALTFDDGPDPKWTPQVLDLLARHGAVATFCVLGENAERHPELITAIVGAGMRLCDHSRTHEVDPAAPEDAFARAEIAKLADAEVEWFRAPGGVWSESVRAAAGAAGMRPLGWSVDSRDWTRPGAEAIVARVEKGIHPGAVVLMHDGGGRREQTVAALDELLTWLSAQCYTTGFPGGR